MYKCGRCGGTFSQFKLSGQCSLCGTWARVGCYGCSQRFIDNGDRCSKCGSVIHVEGQSTAAAVPATQKCPGCGRSIPSSHWSCFHCGHTRWQKILWVGLMSLGCIGFAVFGSPYLSPTLGQTLARWVGWALGGFGLWMTFGAVVVGLKARKK